MWEPLPSSNPNLTTHHLQQYDGSKWTTRMKVDVKKLPNGPPQFGYQEYISTPQLRLSVASPTAAVLTLTHVTPGNGTTATVATHTWNGVKWARHSDATFAYKDQWQGLQVGGGGGALPWLEGWHAPGRSPSRAGIALQAQQWTWQGLQRLPAAAMPRLPLRCPSHWEALPHGMPLSCPSHRRLSAPAASPCARWAHTTTRPAAACGAARCPSHCGACPGSQPFKPAGAHPMESSLPVPPCRLGISCSGASHPGWRVCQALLRFAFLDFPSIRPFSPWRSCLMLQ